MKTDNAILEKSKVFAVRVVKLCQYLTERKKEYVLSRQLLCSGTSIGANIREAVRGQSRSDFRAKMSIALKEASETEYWLELLAETGYLRDDEYQSIFGDCKELVKMLMAIVKSSKSPKE